MGIFDFLKHDKKKAQDAAAKHAEQRSAAPAPAPPRPPAGMPTTHTPPEAAKRSAPPMHTPMPGAAPPEPATPHVPPGTAKRSAPKPDRAAKKRDRD
ncbi:hypothetical protein [Streptomyces sp. NPDC051211]|uniref:hypothetical protein n=1 Tax=Streptomyces sp. NPDC051211 TaxID=3154643 RepID=UPI00344E1D65